MAMLNWPSLTCRTLAQILTVMTLLHLSGVASVDIQLPVALNHFDFQSLPVYCRGSTMHFECKDDAGTFHCLPLSLKCRIQCANDAELKCPNSDTHCAAGQFRCANKGAAAASGAPVCLPDELLCDGRVHCPAGDDESPELCLSGRRTCMPGRFACRSPGHCLPAERRCDGHPDCLRLGLDDRSDEANCLTVRPGPAQATGCADQPDAFRCVDGSGCVRRSYVCDGFADCVDSSDETCGPVACALGEFDCDGRCLSAQLVRCDGRADCHSGSDERDCPEHPDHTEPVAPPCRFASDFRCRRSGACVPRIFLCDGADDCGNSTAEDEICPVNVSEVCRRPDYWVCATGTHCVPASTRCDGQRHCPDASDEANCPTTNPPTTAGGSTEPSDGAIVSTPVSGAADHEGCSFGRCSQLCDLENGRCDCQPGYRSAAPAGSCLAHGAGKLVVVEASGTVELVDLETERAVARFTHLKAAPGRFALDAADRRLIFIDGQGRLTSVRLSDGGSRRDLIRGGLDDVADVAYDWTRRLLFYSMPGPEGSVGVADASGAGWRSVLRVLDCPGALAVDTRSDGPPSLFVVLGCGRQPGLYRMSLDGRSLRLLLDAPAVGRPARLRLDLAQSPPRIYWAEHPGVFSAYLDGRDLRSHATHSDAESSAKTSPVAMEVFEDSIYLPSVSGNSILVVDKFATDFVPRSRLEFATKQVASFLVLHTALQPRDSGFNATACHICQQICLPAAAGSGQVTCLCDWRHAVDPRTGRCNPIGRSIGVLTNPSMATSATASTATTSAQSSPGVLAAIALSAVTVVALLSCGIALFVRFSGRFCVRQSVELHAENVNDNKSRSLEDPMSSVPFHNANLNEKEEQSSRHEDSWTPLTSSTVAATECEVV